MSKGQLAIEIAGRLAYMALGGAIVFLLVVKGII